MIHLISDKLVELIEKHSKVIVKRWSNRLLVDMLTSSFSQKHVDFIEKRAQSLLEQMGKWISYDTSKEEIGSKYAKEGMEYFNMNIPLCEVIRAMYTLRRTLWLFVVNESAFDSAFQLHQMLELSDRVILFFDRAQYYVIRGYTEEMNRKIKGMWDLKPEDTSKIFFEKSFYNQ